MSKKREGRVTVKKTEFKILVRAKEIIEAYDNYDTMVSVLMKEYPSLPTVTIMQCIVVQLRLKITKQCPRWIQEDLYRRLKKHGCQTTVTKFNNLLTYAGERYLARVIANNADMTTLMITNNTDTPLASHSFNDFYDPLTDIYVEEHMHTEAYSRGDTITNEFLIGFAAANFTWKKIGLRNRHNTLIAQQTYDYSGKTDTSAVNVIWELDT